MSEKYNISSYTTALRDVAVLKSRNIYWPDDALIKLLNDAANIIDELELVRSRLARCLPNAN